MALTHNKLYKLFILKRIEGLEHKIQFSSNLKDITIAKKAQTIPAKTEMLSLKMKQRLLPFEIQAGLTSSYLQESLEKELAAVESNAYWSKREIITTAKRQKEEPDERLKQLENQVAEQKQAIYDKYRKEPTVESTRAHRVALTKETSLLEKRVKKIKKVHAKSEHRYLNRMNLKIDLLQKKLDKNHVKLSRFKTEIVNLHLEEGELLRLEHLSMHFGGLKAVDNLTFSVKENSIFGLIGPNGAGKTTVFNCITRFYKPTYGDVYFRNHLNEQVHLNDIKVHNVIKHGIVRTFQNVELIWELNVIDNLLVAAHTKYRSSFFGHLFHSRLLRQEEILMREKAHKILKDLELEMVAYSYPLGLPYGILKKVELARTLMVTPKLIILDEPAAGLNDAETENLAKVIRKIRDDYKTTIFLVEHDMGLVMDICDTVCAISFGKMLAIGTPKEIQSSKVVKEAYLGGE